MILSWLRGLHRLDKPAVDGIETCLLRQNHVQEDDVGHAVICSVAFTQWRGDAEEEEEWGRVFHGKGLVEI